MPVHHIIESRLGLVLITLVGVVTNDDLLDCQARLEANPLYKGDFDRLVDGSEATRFEMTQDVVRAVAKSAVEAGMKRAALVGPSDGMFGLMRMYESYAIGAEVSVFRSLGEAYHWLISTSRLITNIP